MLRTLIFALLAATLAAAQDHPAITIYNGDFAVVRQNVHLDLQAGTTKFTFADVTASLEPESVILRDPKNPLQVLEQNYRNDPVSQDLLLSFFEGKTLDFIETEPDGSKKTVTGKVVRSGHIPNGQNPLAPIVEVDGKLRFSLPGEPLFPALGGDVILKPALSWLLKSSTAGASDAELSYITSGMSWHADYNIVAPETEKAGGDTVDVIGWITMNNSTGKAFENARIKLMAGDVHRVQPPQPAMESCPTCSVVEAQAAAPPVSEKAFDEFHLYTLDNLTTLHDQETKQVEFVRASGVATKRTYIYDAYVEPIAIPSSPDEDQNSNLEDMNKKVAVYQEFKNAKENHLGMPLPFGKVRFYRREDSGMLQFTGENTIDHTPQDETVRFLTGNSFDLVGERRQMNFKENEDAHWIDESFEIKLRNHKKTPATITAVEHLYRWNTWRITRSSQLFKKKDAQTIEFTVTVPADGERIVTYTVHYSW
jgi:hypothetical protein